MAAGGKETLKSFVKYTLVLMLAAPALVSAAELGTDARGAIPRDVQQLVVIDYRAMQNSPTAMELKERVMPPELRQFDDALRKSGLNDNNDVDSLAFALFRPSPTSDSLDTVGIAQGQFPMDDIMAGFRKQKVKPVMVRTNSIYPMTKAGMVLCFVDPSTMIFGMKSAVTKALDARDGMVPSLLNNSTLIDAMHSVDSEPLWSVLDSKGTQTMMKQLMGEAGSVTNYDSVKQRLQASWYSMDFAHGVKLDLSISTGDSFSAATISSLMSAAITVKKMTSTDVEKQALNDTQVTSSGGLLSVRYASSDDQFSSLLQSPLFKSVVQ